MAELGLKTTRQTYYNLKNLLIINNLFTFADGYSSSEERQFYNGRF